MSLLWVSSLPKWIKNEALGIEKKSVAKLQDARTVRKIVKIDEHICLAFAGLVADARVLINKARVHALSTQLSLDEQISVDALTKYVAGQFLSCFKSNLEEFRSSAEVYSKHRRAAVRNFDAHCWIYA